MAEDAAHAGLDDGGGGGLLDGAEEFGDGEAGREADTDGDGQQRDEGLEPDLDDQQEQDGDAEGGDGEQSGGAGYEVEESTGVRGRDGVHGGGDLAWGRRAGRAERGTAFAG